MDMFMDKIAQKLNAQDIIRANTVAETDQLNKLKGQAAEYQECLRKMQKLIDDGISRMEQAGQISSTQDKQLEELRTSVSGLEQKLEAMKVLLAEEEEKLASADGKLVTVDEKLAAVDEKLVSVDGKLSSENSDNSAMEEYIHKECVKVYKNVQAIVVDGNDKLQGNVTECLKNTSGVRGRATAALIFSVLAFLSAAAGLTLQILNGLNINLFSF